MTEGSGPLLEVAVGHGVMLAAAGRTCWDPFWCGRVAAAANPAAGVAVPPQSPTVAATMGRPRQRLDLIQ